MLTSALWFFAGGILYKVLSILFAVNDSRYILQETEDAVIILLDAIDKDVMSAISKKHEAVMEDNELSKKDKKLIINGDLRFLAKWKTFVISKMLLASPKKYFKYFRYLTWEDSLVRLAELKKGFRSIEEERNVD